MKKVIAIILTIIMMLSVLTLVGCGKSGTLSGKEAESVANELQKEGDKLVSEVEELASQMESQN